MDTIGMGIGRTAALMAAADDLPVDRFTEALIENEIFSGELRFYVEFIDLSGLYL